MQIILTHEQADFDALASLLGAFLLDESAIPVLPRRMNRNVRAFLTLYGGDLPLVEARDLPNAAVDNVILVDTQSLVSIRGMSETTRVQVIDHHPWRGQASANWQYSITERGANTTVFVETLQQRDQTLDMLPATLLLLGIYEDTGSLTYDHTTPHDLRAAAFLLEQGASLKLAADFLNHPLSLAQQALYDQLRQNLESHTIQGQTVLVMSADAQEIDEELSSIAHKLRDLLDPDALCMLITTRAGVQMILRSTSDNINVAKIAAHFGGGGHERAAACLVKDRPLPDIQAELVKLLPEFVHPSLTVGQIMSTLPQLLTPQTRVEEAALRMQRYGYEGFPVVENGRVVGLLTRRAVDRAMSHHLNVSIASLFDRGEFSIHPEDSIERLQRLMLETGWGQIPVLSLQDGRIIGIVTRTDLIKTLAPQPRLPAPINLSGRLDAVLPAGRQALLMLVAQAAHEQHLPLFLVGGFVRDLLLERPSLDFDLVVEGDAIALANQLVRRYGGRITSHTRFGTAKWWPAGSNVEPIDLVSARIEFYTHPTALPTVERGSIKLDLHRRDFTINTLALRLDGRYYGELYDYWGGLADLRRGLVRILHSLSFVDDPTRILRAVRFEQRFGFQVETRTLELLQEAAALMERVSGDRLRHELDHILLEQQAAAMLAQLHALGLLAAIHPHLVWDEWFRQRLEQADLCNPPAGWPPGPALQETGTRLYLLYTLWLVRLSPELAYSVGIRLKFSVKLMQIIESAQRLWLDAAQLPRMLPSALVARLDEIPALAQIAVYCACEDPGVRVVMDTYQMKWQHVTTRFTGDDLRRRGLPPGPIYRQVLSSLRSGWLDGSLHTPAEEDALLESLLEYYGSGGLEGWAG